ncbi:hypothetical protein ACSFC1_01495 [Pseudothermotoga sp. U03pept]|uniref:glycoside hydrolase family 38 N-terminal domain-containing protein n=1 Tax=Pseudothermotoga sp. U03pept TaxID=3447012 RepID=UPI003F02FF7F
MKKAYMITHTHWDREWYATFEIFRERLTLLLEKLTQIMSKDDSFKHFHLDGQTIVLEDFQETMGQKEELLKLIRKGRIAVGPWYILADEFLVNSESWIRNYLYSEKIAEQLDIKISKIGYLPDMFGHNAYMPSIIKGLGMKWAVIWRGIDNIEKTTFSWSSPFGDSVNVVYLIHSYSNAAHFGIEREALKEKFIEEAKILSKIDPTNPPLLMNGTDHEIPYCDVGKIIEEASTSEMEFVQTSFEEYISKLSTPKVSVSGELRSPRAFPILKDVTSARIWEKILHHRAEKFYIHYLEPILAISKLLGNSTPYQSLSYGWKLILQCQPHDSICGCSIDEVHRTVQNRLKRSIDHGKALFAKTFLQIMGERTSDMALTFFNPLEREFKGVVESHLRLPEGSYDFVDEENGEIAESVALNCVENSETDLSTLVRFYENHTTKAVENDLRERHTYLVNINVPAFGFKTFKVVPKGKRSENVFNSPHRIKENGTLTLNHAGKTVENLCYLEDIEDVGDEYNYSFAQKEIFTSLDSRATITETVNCSFVKKVAVKNHMLIPESIQSNRKSRSERLVHLPFEIEYTFYRDLPRVDVKLRFTNLAKDHRLSVVFPMKDLTEVITDGYFGPVVHKIENFNADYSQWAELPENNFAMYWFVTIPQVGITISTKGLREVRVEKEGLKITLLRSVEWLSRNDLVTRPGHAGPGIKTPEAQGIGEHSVEFSIILHEDWSLEEVYRKVREYQVPPLAIQGKFEETLSVEKIELTDGFLNAFKPSQNGEGVIVRAFNPEGKSPILRCTKPISETNLAEKAVQDHDRLTNVRSWLIQV